jgi:hypothetical protein
MKNRNLKGLQVGVEVRRYFRGLPAQRLVVTKVTRTKIYCAPPLFPNLVLTFCRKTGAEVETEPVSRIEPMD